jgi:hypothetical protein
MVSAGKPTLPAKSKSTTETNPAIPTSVVRHVIPALTPIPGEKPAAETTAPATPTNEAVAPMRVGQTPRAEPLPTAAPTSPVKATETKPDAVLAPASKPVEKLGPKLRKRDDILKALRAGAKVMKVDGLFRIVASDGTKNATSKRRILSLESQKLLVASSDGNSFTLDMAADKKAQEPKVAPVVKESVKDAK